MPLSIRDSTTRHLSEGIPKPKQEICSSKAIYLDFYINLNIQSSQNKNYSNITPFQTELATDESLTQLGQH
ncbi:hypothetical protein QKD39_gp11 [Psittacine adenovirus 1]|uniref:Uncharacterized protein n=1 Tax=Psittacine adenovirus 1 TaxID=318592 RepID=A0A2Z5E050_9ADEN|nr:hypothetical protein QKD39_gp11 [Psittacine adenovirus 1]AXB73038.1 hypothetical protein [Psittacine adenovirus 1]